MAIFHIDFKILKRSEGKSALYLSAYNSRMRLKDEKTGLIFNYEKKKEDLMHTDILLPHNAPNRFKNRSILWNEIEEIEKRKDAQLSRYFICALPRELSLIENKKLLEEYIQKNFISKGMCADYAIHPKKRKPRQSYINRKNHRNKLKNYNQQLEDIKRKEKKKEDMKKENKLTSFFKNVFNKLTNKQKKEIEERKNREIEAMNQWKKNEEKREELRERLKNENLNNEGINYVDKIQNEQRRDQDYNIPTHKYKI